MIEPLTLPLDRTAIERILPHRHPFLLVDRIIELEPDRRIVGVKDVVSDEPFLTRGLDERPAFASTILIEAVAQVGAILVLANPENRGKLIFFMGIKRARLRRPVHAGDSIVIEAIVRLLRSRTGLFEGTARVDGRLIADGAMTFALGPETVEGRPVRASPT